MNLSSEALSWSRRLAYAAPAFALAAAGIPIYVHIPKFYTDVVGVDVAALGFIILALRVFDGVIDPVLGFASDHTHTRFGRRRPYILGAALPLALSIGMLFSPPHTDAATATTWFGAWIFSLFFFWSSILVPYESLGPEITFDYDERTAILGMRDGFMIAGTLAAAVVPTGVAWALGLTGSAEDERTKFFYISALYAPLILGTCLWCVLALREPPLPKEPELEWREGLRRWLQPGFWGRTKNRFSGFARNRPFLVLLASYTVGALGSNLPATLILYYTTYVLHSRLADLAMLLYFISGIVFLPGWIALSRRLGKKWTYLSAMIVNTGAFAGVFFLGNGDEWAFVVMVAVSGIGYGATFAIPSSMQADVIDYDELLTGERREGQYMGLWTLARSLAAAVGVGAALPILGAVGYVPNVEQTPRVIFTLRVIYAVVPCVCNLAAFLIALAYPIDRASHAAIKEAILVRRAGGPVVDPLKVPRSGAGAPPTLPPQAADHR